MYVLAFAYPLRCAISAHPDLRMPNEQQRKQSVHAERSNAAPRGQPGRLGEKGAAAYATYYLWVVIPAKLVLLAALIHMIVSGNTNQAGWFLSHVWLPVSTAAFMIITPFIYGLWRSLKVFFILGVILAFAAWLLR